MGADEMGMFGFDADEARYDRQNRMNPPEFAPGQGDGLFEQDIFATSTVPANNSVGGDIFGGGGLDPSGGGMFGGGGGDPFSSSGGSIFGGGGSSMFGGGAGMDMFGASAPPLGGNAMMPGIGSPLGSQQQQPMSDEDKFFNAIGKGFKGIFAFFKDISSSFKGVNALFWQQFGFKVSCVSIAVIALGIITRIFGFKSGFGMAIGACLSGVVGVLCLFMNTEEARKYSTPYGADNSQAPAPVLSPAPIVNQQPDFGGAEGDNFDFDREDSWYGYEEDAFSFGDDSDDDEDIDEDEDDDLDFLDNTTEEMLSHEDALESMPEVPAGMYTRQYLWDMFIKVIPTMKPDFSELRDIDEDDDTFLVWSEKLREAAEASGSKEDYLPELLRLQENLFTIIVTCDRPTGFKPEACATELANIFAYRDGEFKQGVFAKTSTVGKNCIITVFTGTSAMVSLKDMMLEEKDYFLDSNNVLPVALGIDQLGKVIKTDLKKLESIIVSGMPRSGKSWFVQAVLTQMCAFSSPSDLIFYICDPKEGISDFKSFCLPHVRKFVSGDNAIVQTLRTIIRDEGPRRKKIIGDAGFVNIWDYKEKYPDVELPVLYVVIDEVVTLAERMEKETKKEFMGYLIELISQLPAVGIRAFLIPHVIKNDIIPKTATDLVPCKVSVKGDAEHIEKATGSKPKDFPYKLSNQGDMAVKLSNVPNTMYVHGPALTHSNPENNELFNYMRRVWAKLQPDSISGSVAEGAQEEMENQKLLESFEDSSSIDEFFTNSTNEQNLFGINS